MAWSRSWRIDSRERWRSVLKALLAIGVDFARHPVEIVVQEEVREKTHDQRKLWHALLTEFGRELGYRLPEIKLIVKKAYYGAETVTLPDGRSFEIVKSSEKEDRGGYSELIEFTLQFAAEQGINLSTNKGG